MAWLDDYLAEQVQNGRAGVVRELEEGERTVRVFSPGYEIYAEDRSHERDWSRLRRAKVYLSGVPDTQGQIESAVDHIIDALDEDLPEQARREHYDIVGARIWAALGAADDPHPGYWHAFQEWMRGEGVKDVDPARDILDDRKRAGAAGPEVG